MDRKPFYKEKEAVPILVNLPKGKSMKAMWGLLVFCGGWGVGVLGIVICYEEDNNYFVLEPDLPTTFQLDYLSLAELDGVLCDCKDELGAFAR